MSFCLLIENSVKTLRALHLGYCSQLSDRAVTFIANSCTSLEDLDLSNLPISDETLFMIVHRHKNLLRLTLNSCFQITASGLTRMLPGCEKVVQLSLKEVNMNDRTFEFIRDVPSVLPRLQLLNVTQSLEFAGRYSSKSIQLLRAARPNLTIITTEA